VKEKRLRVSEKMGVVVLLVSLVCPNWRGARLAQRIVWE